MNVVEILPPGFHPSSRARYPVLFRCYGGPGSQLVSSRFERDWHTYLASTLGIIVVVVDGRGTGLRGRAFRSPVAGHLGDLEARDQIAAAAIYANLTYVDPRRVGIWGWCVRIRAGSAMILTLAGLTAAI
jgi:dipeptidyl aminopeptidase